MSRYAGLVAAGLTAITLVACDDDDADSKSPLVTSPTSVGSGVDSTAAPVDGDAFVDPDGVFSIMFPTKPQATPTSAPLANGGFTDLVLYVADDASNTYLVNCSDYATADGGDRVLEEARDGTIEQVGGTLVTSEAIELQGRLGVDFTATSAAGDLTGRLFLSEAVLCQIAVLGDDSDAAEAFLDSFQFLEAAA